MTAVAGMVSLLSLHAVSFTRLRSLVLHSVVTHSFVSPTSMTKRQESVSKRNVTKRKPTVGHSVPKDLCFRC
jgi:hypothetical protein